MRVKDSPVAVQLSRGGKGQINQEGFPTVVGCFLGWGGLGSFGFVCLVSNIFSCLGTELLAGKIL